jgi:HD-like signal output (HDOD) protein
MKTGDAEYSFMTEELRNKDIPVKELCTILNGRKQGFLAEPAGYMLKELTDNAVRANIKRAFFIEEGLDIYSRPDYESGMKKFKAAYSDEETRIRLEKLCRLNNMKVNIRFHESDESLVIVIENTGIRTGQEKERIEKRLSEAARSMNPERIMSEIGDNTEGAGLGLLLSVRILNKNGFAGNPIRFEDTPGSTKVSITIPGLLLPPAMIEKLSDEISSRIKYLPPLPQKLRELMELLDNSDCELSSVEHFLRTDPGLTADVLRCANSPIYRNNRQIVSLEAAIKTVGIRGIQRILYFSGARKILEKGIPAEEIKAYSTHSFAVAAIASAVLAPYGKNMDKMEIYTAGLLHDLGRLVLLTLPDSHGKSGRVLDILSDGDHHGTVGYHLALHWNFPHSLADAIRFHHFPEECSSRNRVLTGIIYLADKMAGVIDNRISTGEINPETARFLGINSHAEIDNLIIQSRKTILETEDDPIARN